MEEEADGSLRNRSEGNYREEDSNLHVPGTPDPELFPDDPCAVLTNSEFVDP